MSKALRKGWCPGALRPMQSGDGLIVRLRISGGALSPALARAIAGCAEKFGNGRIDLSARANLQLRGVRQDALGALQAELARLDLLDEDPEVEAIRNLLASPLAGLDPAAADIAPMVAAFDERLRRDPIFRRLPPKFLFAIDDGGSLPLPLDKADIGFVATRGGSAFVVRVAGQPIGTCRAESLPDAASGIASLFLGHRRDDERRMAHLVARLGVDTLVPDAGLDPLPEHLPLHTTTPAKILGLHSSGTKTALGLGISFGRLDAKSLLHLADTAEATQGALRLSPWRAIFLIAEAIDARSIEALAAAGFMLDDAAPLRAVAACSGRPACLQGQTDAQADARHLATSARGFGESGIALHVSACAKGCAHVEKAPVTLVGHDGLYDLILDGSAGDAPLLAGLTLPEVESLLTRLAERAASERGGFIQNFLCEVGP